MSFKQNKYVIIRNVLSYEFANFAFNYFLLKRDAVAWMQQNNYISEFTPGFGTWKDAQIPNTFSCYGDMFMETLMIKLLPVMNKNTKLDLSKLARKLTVDGGGHSYAAGGIMGEPTLAFSKLFSPVK